MTYHPPKYWPDPEPAPWPEEAPISKHEADQAKWFEKPQPKRARKPPKGPGGRPASCAWEKIGAGVFLGQPYQKREGSPHQHFWVVRVDALRSGVGRRYFPVSLEQAEARAEAERRAGVWATLPTIDLVLAAWLREWGPQMKPRTLQRTASLVKIELAWWAKTPVTQITSPMLWRFVQHWIRLGKSPSTIKQALAWLRRATTLLWNGELEAFTWAPPNVGREGRDPAWRITAATEKMLDRYGHMVVKRDAFTPDEIKHVFKVVSEEHPEWYPFVRLAFGTGMRCAELRALKWDCVDLDARIVILKRSFSGNHENPPKAGHKGYRTVHLPRGCVAMLRELREQTLSDLSKATGEWVFQRNRDFLTEGATQYALGLIFEKARARGVRADMTLHCCRHTYVSQAQAEGIADGWIRHNAGMSASTLARYSHMHDRPELDWADFGEKGLHSEPTAGIVAQIPDGDSREEHSERPADDTGQDGG